MAILRHVTAKWMRRLQRATLPIGIVFLVLVVVAAFLYSIWSAHPFRMVQAALSAAIAIYLIWQGWSWRKTPPASN